MAMDIDLRYLNHQPSSNSFALIALVPQIKIILNHTFEQNENISGLNILLLFSDSRPLNVKIENVIG
jgi:hypothetical protein